MDIEKTLDETESFLKNNESSIPKDVLTFLVDICRSERQYVAMVKSWSKTKGVLKVPEPKLKQY